MYQPLAEGGLNLVKALRLAWIIRFLSNSWDSWKAIPNSEMQNKKQLNENKDHAHI